jgi:hypothetical protein
MVNIAFNIVKIPGGQNELREQVVLSSMEGDGLANLVNEEGNAENSESESNTELFPENFEIGLFVSQTALIAPIASLFKGDLNDSISGYKNHVAELNSPPPKAV